ncbi:MAG: Sapep family Mn(2+)-dependent dipeptidase [Christensenellales bacterium]|jgi:succinyl-diaminopimelate desuccinylase
MKYKDYLNDNFPRMTTDLARLISIDSSKSEPKDGMPYGEGPFRALECVMDIAKELGLDARSVDGHVAVIEYGSGPKTLGVLTHADVVPAGDKFKVPPFGGIIKDNRMYGRGTVDNKGPAVASIYALAALKATGFVPRDTIRLIIGSDEESGWADLRYYAQKEKLPDYGFSPDGDYPVINCEKGVLHLSLKKRLDKSDYAGVKRISAGHRANMVPDYAEIEYENGGKLRFDGVSAHGSAPHCGDSALFKLLEASPSFNIPQPLGEALSWIRQSFSNTFHGENVGLNLSDEQSGRLTLNPGVLNLSDGLLELLIDIRYPVSFARDDIMRRLSPAIEKAGFIIELLNEHDPHYVAPDHPLVKTLLEVYERETGLKGECLSIGGATYARAIPDAVTFGPVFPGTASLCHQPDEYIELHELKLNAHIIASAMYELTK